MYRIREIRDQLKRMIEDEDQEAGNEAAAIGTPEFVKPAHNLSRTEGIKPATAKGGR